MSASSDINRLTEAYSRGARWLDAHIDELTKAHPNQWIAVHEDRLIAADAELGRVEDEAERLCPLRDVVFQFVDDGTLIFGLHL